MSITEGSKFQERAEDERAAERKSPRMEKFDRVQAAKRAAVEYVLASKVRPPFVDVVDYLMTKGHVREDVDEAAALALKETQPIEIKTPPPARGDDVEAFFTVVRTLSPLPHEARSRILRSVALFFGVTRADGETPLALPVDEARR